VRVLVAELTYPISQEGQTPHKRSLVDFKLLYTGIFNATCEPGVLTLSSCLMRVINHDVCCLLIPVELCLLRISYKI